MHSSCLPPRGANTEWKTTPGSCALRHPHYNRGSPDYQSLPRAQSRPGKTVGGCEGETDNERNSDEHHVSRAAEWDGEGCKLTKVKSHFNLSRRILWRPLTHS